MLWSSLAWGLWTFSNHTSIAVTNSHSFGIYQPSHPSHAGFFWCHFFLQLCLEGNWDQFFLHGECFFYQQLEPFLGFLLTQNLAFPAFLLANYPGWPTGLWFSISPRLLSQIAFGFLWSVVHSSPRAKCVYPQAWFFSPGTLPAGSFEDRRKALTQAHLSDVLAVLTHLHPWRGDAHTVKELASLPLPLILPVSGLSS